MTKARQNGLPHRFKTLIAFAVLLGGFALPAQAQTVQLLGDFNAWSSYSATEGGGEICFALTRPTEVEPSPEGYSQAYLYVTHRPSESVRNEINLVAGVPLAPDSTATVTVGGQSWEMFTQQDAAWLEAAAESEALAQAIRAGSSLSIVATTAAGIRFTQTYSLSGATASARAIDGAC
jgi:hypothetical protein